MTSDDAHGGVAPGLSRLTRLTPDPVRAERVRRNAGHGSRDGGGVRLPRDPVERCVPAHCLTPVVVGGVCVLYAFALLVTTLRLGGYVLTERVAASST